MAIADEVMDRYEARKGGKAVKKDGPEPKAEAKDEGDEDTSARDSAKALIAAVKRGDADAVIEAVRAICNDY